MLNTGSNINKAFTEKIEINMVLNFSYKIMTHIRKVLKKENTRVIPYLMFSDNINNMIFKVLISVVYCIIDNYLCADYL